jgi:hypothetical protein
LSRIVLCRPNDFVHIYRHRVQVADDVVKLLRPAGEIVMAENHRRVIFVIGMQLAENVLVAASGFQFEIDNLCAILDAGHQQRDPLRIFHGREPAFPIGPASHSCTARSASSSTKIAGFPQRRQKIRRKLAGVQESSKLNQFSGNFPHRVFDPDGISPVEEHRPHQRKEFAVQRGRLAY